MGNKFFWFLSELLQKKMSYQTTLVLFVKSSRLEKVEHELFFKNKLNNFVFLKLKFRKRIKLLQESVF